MKGQGITLVLEQSQLNFFDNSSSKSGCSTILRNARIRKMSLGKTGRQIGLII